MPSKTEVTLQQWQLYNPLDKSTKPPEMPSSRKLPYSKSTSLTKDTLKQPKVSSIGVAPPRKSLDVNELKVMLVGSSVIDQPELTDGDIAKSKKKSLELDQTATAEKISVEKHKMPAILSSEGTTGKPTFAFRAKPPAMPRSKIKQKRKAKLLPHQSFEEATVHTTTPIPDENREVKSGKNV